MAARLAQQLCLTFTEHHPAKEVGRNFTTRAHSRNQKIVDDAHMLIALPGPNSKGTYDSIRRAHRKGIPIVVLNVPE